MKTNLKVVLFFICCLLLQSCVQDTHLKQLIIKVDMNQEENVQSVGLRGNLKPLSWEHNMEMNDIDGDGVYEIQLELNTASDYLQFKFVKNDTLFELEGSPNRKLSFEYRPETLSYQGTFDQTESN